MKISFFVQSYQKEGFAQSEVSLKNFCMHELKIKALRYSDANKNIKQFLWILLLNETSLHPILRNAHQTPHIASSTIPIFQYQAVIVLPS